MMTIRYRVNFRQVILGLVKNPVVYLRGLGVIFSIVVFGCLADKGYAIANGGFCLINKPDETFACDLGIAAGVVGMVMCLGFFAIDILYIILKENRIRGILLLIDVAAYTFWGIFWFISFCIILHHWNNTASKDLIEQFYGRQTVNSILAAICFAAFSVAVWGTIILLDIIFVIRGPGFPCHPNSEEVLSPREEGYIDFPNIDTPSGNYEPPN